VSEPRIGIFLNVQQPDTVAPHTIIEQAVAHTALCRDLGFDLVSAGQHFLTEVFQMAQLMPLLARIAADAGDMRVASNIALLTLLNPVELAENTATLDAITGGRFVLGVGLGYRPEEFDAFGIPEKKVRIFLDKLDVVKRLLEGESVTAEGLGYKLVNQRLAMQSTQSPRPPIWLAANADSAVKRAARVADTWTVNPHANLAELVRQTAMFHEARAEAGLPVVTELPVMKEIYVGEDDESAEREARSYLQAKYKAYVKWGQDEVMPDADSLDQDWEDLKAGGRFILGGPDRCVAELQEHLDALRCDTLIFRFGWVGMPDELVQGNIRRFAETVKPRLRVAAGAPAPL
jgi:alkanesulfonate monooxygenase SsuD/methylene tetrahydromethanopterin reductase-like flavin-dependent oxidoreductase (luciferase family)